MPGVRIGQKLIEREKIFRIIDELLLLRSRGLSQQEVAEQVGLDRAFISKLEGLGEVRKGQSVAVIGFPVANKDQVIQVAKAAGVDDWLVLTEQERLNFIKDCTGKELLDKLMGLITRFRRFDVLVVLASDQRIKLIKALVDNEVLGLELGTSPLTADQTVPIFRLRQLLGQLGLHISENQDGEGDDLIETYC